jgi:hypothetical protein
MLNEKEQSPDSLRSERFAGLSAAAAGLSWNTYKRVEPTWTTPGDSVNVYFPSGSLVTFIWLKFCQQGKKI